MKAAVCHSDSVDAFADMTSGANARGLVVFGEGSRA